MGFLLWFLASVVGLLLYRHELGQEIKVVPKSHLYLFTLVGLFGGIFTLLGSIGLILQNGNSNKSN
jgi:hypothetical protein